MWRPAGRLVDKLGKVLGIQLALSLVPIGVLWAQDWEPAPPMPDEFDWVQLTSGEWLKGEIRVMYQETLEFESEELDVLSFDLEDIQVIRSAQVINLRMRSGETATGQLLLDGDDVTIISDDELTTTRGNILTVTVAAQRERNLWTGDIGINGVLRSGNTDQVDTGADVRFQRRTVLSRMSMDFSSDYTETNDIRTVDTQSGHFSWDRFRSATVFVRPFFLDYFRDPFQNIESRYTMGVGVGYQLRDTATIDWSIFVGPAFQETQFDEVEVGEDDHEKAWALSAGTVFDISLTNRIDVIGDYRFQFAKEEIGGYSHRLTTTLEFDLTDRLDFDISGEWSRTESPKPNADGTLPEQDDYRVTFGLSLEF